jgi:hypothetical protein
MNGQRNDLHRSDPIPASNPDHNRIGNCRFCGRSTARRAVLKGGGGVWYCTEHASAANRIILRGGV